MFLAFTSYQVILCVSDTVYTMCTYFHSAHVFQRAHMGPNLNHGKQSHLAETSHYCWGGQTSGKCYAEGFRIVNALWCAAIWCLQQQKIWQKLKPTGHRKVHLDNLRAMALEYRAPGHEMCWLLYRGTSYKCGNYLSCKVCSCCFSETSRNLISLCWPVLLVVHGSGWWVSAGNTSDLIFGLLRAQ